MESIDNATGLAFEISNNKEYLSIASYEDKLLKTSFDNVQLEIANYATSIGLCKENKLDLSKINLLSKLFVLGNLDGGEVTTKYLNGKINLSKEKVNNLEILLYRLKKIFPDEEVLFSLDFINDLKQMFEENTYASEQNMIRLAYLLEIASRHMVDEMNHEELAVIKFIISEIVKMRENYKSTGKLALNLKMNEYINSIVNNSDLLSQEEKEILDDIVNQYNENRIDRMAFIELITELNYSKKKINGKGM